jgi:N6-adenosine-specific RNA methylase IME4/ParB-like chromosome segregation protein Spo0J
MKQHIQNIIVADTRRHIDDMKVRELADSIGRIGLLNPITVTSHNMLVAGGHRLEACRLLGMTEIETTVMPGDEFLQQLAEIDENLVRNELDAIAVGELAIKRDDILEAMGLRANQSNKGKSTGAESAPVKTTANIAKEIGMSERALQVNKQLARDLVPEAKEAVRKKDVPKKDALKMSRMEPERQKAVAKKLATGQAKSVVDANRLIAKENVHETMALETSTKYRVIYADPPWCYGNKLVDGYGAAENHYPTMTIEELCDLPVTEISDENAVLFLWTTSPLLEESFEVIRAWGFKYKSSFVWDKVKHNMGHYNSVRHEFLLIATKGSCTPDVQKLFDSVVSVERSTKHSEKPQEFREIIDTLYPNGKRVELFARKQSNNWDIWGNQT